MEAAGKRLLFQAKEGKACGAGVGAGLGGREHKTGQMALLSVRPAHWASCGGDSATAMAESRFPRSPSHCTCCPRALLQPPCKVGSGETCPKAIPCHMPLFAAVPVFGCPWVLGTGGSFSTALLRLC